MPTISSIYSNLARQGLAKSFTHGYAQSVVAATHPASYPNQHNRTFIRRPSRLAKLNNLAQFHNAFHSSAQTSSLAAAVQDVRAEKVANSHAGLDAYFEAWQTHSAKEEPEKEWTQYQFAKRIEWKPSQAVADLLDSKVASFIAARTSIRRTHSDSALSGLTNVTACDNVDTLVEDIAHTEYLNAEQTALHELTSNVHTVEETNDVEDVLHTQVVSSLLAISKSPTSSASTILDSPATSVTTLSSITDVQSQSFAAHLTELADNAKYYEIPTVFQSMLAVGVQPTATAYNALLRAALNCDGDESHRISKALDVYSDMHRRNVSPDSAFYNTILSSLASRSTQITAMRRELEVKRLRFGGRKDRNEFMFASNEIDCQILAEDDKLSTSLRVYEHAAQSRDVVLSTETWDSMLEACVDRGNVSGMVALYKHMRASNVAPTPRSFLAMIRGFVAAGDLRQAIDKYFDEYKQFAVNSEAHSTGFQRSDASVHAAIVKGYVDAGKQFGAEKFYNKCVAVYPDSTMSDTIIATGFVPGLLSAGNYAASLDWTGRIRDEQIRYSVLGQTIVQAADCNMYDLAGSTFAMNPAVLDTSSTPAIALLAMHVRCGELADAARFWDILSSPSMSITPAFIDVTAMYASALIGAGDVNGGLMASEQMFSRIRASARGDTKVAMEIEEAMAFIADVMTKCAFKDPRSKKVAPRPLPGAQSFDPYAQSTDFNGSLVIAEELDRGESPVAKTARYRTALERFRKMRAAGRHPKYTTYAKLITTGAREGDMNAVRDVLSAARVDVPFVSQFPAVRAGWALVLDAAVGGCLTLGDRHLASQYHQELHDIGCAPTANTFGLYITTLKEGTKTFDEASEAVKIFQRAVSEGVKPSSFLYNALIGKLGKARRIDDCLFYFNNMRAQNVQPTSVTYGTVVNALCRVSNEKTAEDVFEEMESMPNYKARAAPYNSLMQFFLQTKLDKSRVLSYYERMKARGIQPTSHTYKLLVDTHATLDPINMPAAEAVLDVMRATGEKPEAVHYASLIHAYGCGQRNLTKAREVFDHVMADPSIRPQNSLYQALFESMVANHRVQESDALLQHMAKRRVEMTPYIANTLIHGWVYAKDIRAAERVYAMVRSDKREPSTYEAMTRAYISVKDGEAAGGVVAEMSERGYPHAVSNKIINMLSEV